MSFEPIPLRFKPPQLTFDERLIAVEAAAALLDLPQTRMVVRADAVHVVVNDVEQYARWVYALGGVSVPAPDIDGASLWTLRTKTPIRADGSTVAIRVHVAVVDGETVPVEFHGSVIA